MKKWAWVIGIALLTAALLVCGMTTVAQAESENDHELTWLNNGYAIGTQRSFDGVTVYTVTYTEGMALTARTAIEGTVSIRQQTGGQVDCVTDAGTYDVTVQFVDKYVIDYRLVVLPKTLTLTWQEDTLQGEYGKTVQPVATVAEQGIPQGTYTVGYYLDEEGQKPLSAASVGQEITVYAKVEGRNYTGLLQGSMRIDKCKAQLSAQVPTDALYYDRPDGEPYSVAQLLQPTLTEGYQLPWSTYIKQNNQWIKTDAIGRTGTYTVKFAFDDANARDKYEYPESEEYTLVLQRSATTLHTAQSIQYGYCFGGYTYDNVVWDSGYGQGMGFWVESAQGLLTMGSTTDFAMDKFSFAYLDSAGQPLSEPPHEVGEYQVTVTFLGNENYLPAESVTIALRIVRQDMGKTIFIEGTQPLAYGSDLQSVMDYHLPQDYVDWAAVYGDDVAVSYAVRDAQGQYLPLAEIPVLPGLYRKTVSVDNACYTGQAYCDFEILAAPLPNQDTAVLGALDEAGQLAFVYGQTVAVTPTLATATDGHLQVVYKGNNYTATTTPPVDAGVYDIVLQLDGDSIYSYTQEFVGALRIDPKPLAVTVCDKWLPYGDSLPVVLRFGEGYDLTWDEQDIVRPQDAAAILAGVALSVQNEDGTWQSMPDGSMTAGNTYALRVEGRLDNYSLQVTNGALHIEKRKLNVHISNVTVYENSAVRPVISVDNVAYGEDSAALAACFAAVAKQGDTVLDGMPSTAGTYTLTARVVNEAALANYTPVYTAGQLTVRSLTLLTNTDDFRVEGKFEAGALLNVAQGSTQGLGDAVPRGYVAKTVYELRQTVSTADNNVQVSLAAPAGTDDIVVLVSYDGNSWERVDFVVTDGRIRFGQSVLGSRYAVCVRRDIPWVLIGGIAGGAVGAVLVIVLIVVLVRRRRAAHVEQAAVAAPSGKGKTDEEELDDLIANFDQSTVQHTLTPAERIALREQEEKYAQYRLRLARMRQSGDKAIQDQLRSYGLGQSGDDDDAIIAQMIARDEERAKQLEEELRKEQEEQQQQQEKPVAIILDKRDEVLEQRSFAPTKPQDDDDDIDI